MTAPEAGPAGPTELVVGGRTLRISRPDRVLWPDVGFTKLGLIEYLVAVAPALLPHLGDRGVTIRRFPEGVEGPGWYQAECRSRPAWMRTHDVVARDGRTFHYCMLEEPAALAWAANLGTLELHPFLAPSSRPEAPAAMVIDLDPGPPRGILDAAVVALRVRDRLEADGLRAYPKTSGGRGIHVLVPLAPGHTFGATKAYARGLGEALAGETPDLVTATVDRTGRAGRAGRVFVDWVQNDAGRSTVAPYSPRALPLPFVATPLPWEELEAAVAAGDPRTLRFGPPAVLDRVAELGDLHAHVLTDLQTLPPEARPERAAHRSCGRRQPGAGDAREGGGAR